MREEETIESKPNARSVPMSTSGSLPALSSTIETKKPEIPNLQHSRDNKYDWKMEQPLRSFPPDYCLQRHTTFVANVPAHTILERLGRRLKHASCDCHWDGEGQLDILKDSCKLSIFLWRVDDDENRTLVELQRQQGCSVATQWCRRRLFRAVVEPSEPCNSDLLEFPEFPNVPESCKAHAVVVSKETSGFAQIEGLLQSCCRRQNQLGLEQMLYLLRKEPLEMCQRVFQEDVSLMKYLQKYIYQEESCIEDRDETLSFLAWQFLAKALATVAQYEEDPERIVIDKTMLRECHLERAIQQSLQRVQERPQEATFAIQCWYWIDHFVPLPWDDEEAFLLLKAAHEYGTQHHHCLEQESSRMIQILTLAGSKQPL
ncbi:hypothetical protein FisN_16Hh037 [Fistulifera solaris]|uniref:Uncharacterized protein n=1 Tax=Fistulifera solaris TaxID=1519565 RepID=A0A1Z5KGV4_FISSO|nr:hypothetical protein FisN_16Hh037 [Fistulifera solaris]|eukprot:GAX25198.1 hypothetical protein FisN_16Hh037 [Fistulifera solaris]